MVSYLYPERPYVRFVVYKTIIMVLIVTKYLVTCYFVYNKRCFKTMAILSVDILNNVIFRVLNL